MKINVWVTGCNRGGDQPKHKQGFTCGSLGKLKGRQRRQRQTTTHRVIFTFFIEEKMLTSIKRLNMTYMTI